MVMDAQKAQVLKNKSSEGISSLVCQIFKSDVRTSSILLQMLILFLGEVFSIEKMRLSSPALEAAGIHHTGQDS